MLRAIHNSVLPCTRPTRLGQCSFGVHRYKDLSLGKGGKCRFMSFFRRAPDRVLNSHASMMGQLFPQAPD